VPDFLNDVEDAYYLAYRSGFTETSEALRLIADQERHLTIVLWERPKAPDTVTETQLRSSELLYAATG